MSSNGQHYRDKSDLIEIGNNEKHIQSDRNGNKNIATTSNDGQLTYSKLILCAVIIGISGGLVATIYYFVLETTMHGMWHTLPEIVKLLFPSWLPTTNYVWIATTVGGFFVGLALYFLGLPGEMAQVVDKIHSPGKIDIRKSPAMVIASLIAIIAIRIKVRTFDF